MRKFLKVAALLAVFAVTACGEKTEDGMMDDTTTMMAAPADSMGAMVDSMGAMVDSMGHMVDSMKDMVDTTQM